jgi:hypothetical protein
MNTWKTGYVAFANIVIRGSHSFDSCSLTKNLLFHRSTLQVFKALVCPELCIMVPILSVLMDLVMQVMDPVFEWCLVCTQMCTNCYCQELFSWGLNDTDWKLYCFKIDGYDVLEFLSWSMS